MRTTHRGTPSNSTHWCTQWNLTLGGLPELYPMSRSRKRNKKEYITGATGDAVRALAVKLSLLPYKPSARRASGCGSMNRNHPGSTRTCYEDDSGRHACGIWEPIKRRCTGVRPPRDTCLGVISVWRGSDMIYWVSWKRSSAYDKCLFPRETRSWFEARMRSVLSAVRSACLDQAAICHNGALQRNASLINRHCVSQILLWFININGTATLKSTQISKFICEFFRLTESNRFLFFFNWIRNYI